MERMKKMYGKKKRIAAMIVMIMVLLGSAACGKNAENAGQTGSFGVEAEDLPIAEVMSNGETSKEGGAQTPAGENGDSGQAAGEEDGALHDANGDKELYGDIREVGEGAFTVTEIHVEIGEGGSMSMVSAGAGTDGEPPKISVVYDEDTKFTKQKIWNGGANHEEREGSPADLQKGFTAEMNGSYEGNVFHAAEILIVEVILD